MSAVPITVRVERPGSAPEVRRFDRHVLQIGRDPGCDLVLEDEGVAGRHLVLGAAGGQIRAYDQGAGTTVNGRRVGSVVVGTGDVLGIGSVRLVVALGDDPLPPVVVEAPRVRTLLEALDEDHKNGRITDFEWQSRRKGLLRDGTANQPAPPPAVVETPVAPAAPAPTGWGSERRVAPNVWSVGGRTDDPTARTVHPPLASGIGDGKAFLFLFGFRRAAEVDQKMMAMELEHLPPHVEVLRRAGYTVVVDKEANRADFLAAVAGEGEGVSGLVPAGFYWSAHGEEDGALHCSDGDVVEPGMVDAARVAPGLRLAVLAACYVGCRSRTWRKALGGRPLVVGWGRPVNMVRAVEFLQSNPDTNADLDDLIRRFLLEPGPIPPDHGDRFAATAEASARARLGDVPQRVASIADRLGARWRQEERWVLLEVPVDEGRRQMARVFVVDSAEPHSEGEPLLAVESEVGELSAVVDASTLLAGLAPPSYARVALVKGTTDMPRIVTQGFLPLASVRNQDLAALVYQVAAWGDVLERRIFGGDRRLPSPRSGALTLGAEVIIRNDTVTTDPGNKPTQTLARGAVLERRYKIEDLLATGGMAEIYVARHMVVGRQVALKLLKAEFARDEATVERFMNEARAAGMLGHPHIAECADAGYTEDGVPYLVLELMKGMSLRALIDVEKQLPEARAVAITMQCASALEMAHHNNIVHRDLKPENIFIIQRAERDEFVKVLDFGISKFRSHARGATVEGRMLGTPDYMSPEQISHAHAVDARCDVWALGVTLYEMLTGAAPFGHLPFPKNVLAIESESVPDVRVAAPQVSEGLAKVIAHMLERDLDKRMADMRQVFNDLAPFAGSLVPPKITAHHVDIPQLAVGTQPTLAQPSQPPGPRGTPYPGAMRGHDSTTAGGSIPIDQNPPKKSSTPMIAVIGVVAVAALGLGYFKFGPGASGAAPAPSASAAVASGVKLSVTGTSGMTMMFRGQQVTIPHDAPVSPGQVAEVLELSAPGHTTLRYRLTVDRPLSLHVELPTGTGARDATSDELARAFGLPVAPPTAAPTSTSVESSQVGDVVKKNKAQVQTCVDAVPANVELKAPIVLKGTVDAQGAVTTLEVETTPTQQKVGDCIKNAFKTWRFPAGEASRSVTYKFKFE